MAAWVWVLIPLAGIAMGAFSEWLKFKEKSNKLGDATVALQDVFDEMKVEIQNLRDTNSGLRRRVEVLEAIVTDESFDDLMQKRLEQSTRDIHLIDPPDSSKSEESPKSKRRKTRS